MTLPIWQFIMFLLLALIGGGAGGFFGARALMKRELKKNPPVNEKMIRAMFLQMGRKPSEKEIKRVVKAMNDANN
jgi:uncharacterized protein YneF (UPF0154 family)